MAESPLPPIHKNLEDYCTPTALRKTYEAVSELHDELYSAGGVPSGAIIAMMCIALHAKRSNEEVELDLQREASAFFEEQCVIRAALEEQAEAVRRRARDAERKKEERAAKRRKRALEQLGTDDPDAAVSSDEPQPKRRSRSRPAIQVIDSGVVAERPPLEYPDTAVLLSPPHALAQ